MIALNLSLTILALVVIVLLQRNIVEPVMNKELFTLTSLTFGSETSLMVKRSVKPSPCVGKLNKDAIVSAVNALPIKVPQESFVE
jgi:hypothetical protein